MESIFERIAVVDEDGIRLVVEKRAIHVSRSKSRRMHKMEMYHLSTGELINFVGATEFIVAATGMRLSSRI